MDVGIVGCGVIGGRHAAAFVAAGHRVVAVADPVEASRLILGRAHGARAYADAVDMIEQERLDVVSVCAPPAVRLAPIAAAARRGAHVFCEKPMALTLAEAETLWATACRAGIALGFGFKMRYEGAFAEAQRRIRAGTIGPPDLAVLTYFQPVPPIPWYLDIGALSDIVVHTIDLAAWFLGSPAGWVRADLRHTFNPKAEDRAELTLECGSGRALIAGGYYETFPPVAGHTDICFQVLGPRGYVAGSRSQGLLVVTERGTEHVPTEQGDGFAGEIRAFSEALTRDPRTIPVTGLDGLRAQAVIEAAHTSARSGRAVPVRDVGGAPAVTAV